MALRAAGLLLLLLCLLSLAQLSEQQNGKARQKPAASKKGKGQRQLPCEESLQGLGGGDAVSPLVWAFNSALVKLHKKKLKA